MRTGRVISGVISLAIGLGGIIVGLPHQSSELYVNPQTFQTYSPMTSASGPVIIIGVLLVLLGLYRVATGIRR